jgi:hypothetical protein
VESARRPPRDARLRSDPVHRIEQKDIPAEDLENLRALGYVE